MNSVFPSIARMSGAKDATYEPWILKSPESSASEPKRTACLPAARSCSPNSWAVAATCQGRKTTSTPASIRETSEPKSVVRCETDSRVTSTPRARSLVSTPLASCRE